MAWIILLIFIGGPLLELSVLIDVGGEIGAVPTVLLCVLTAAIGLSLVRLQGLKVLQNMQTATQSGQPIGENLIHGFFLLVSGVCLFIPGFVTDAIGGLLLIPFIRLFLGRAGLANMVVRSNMSGRRGSAGFHASGRESSKGVTIDGEYHKEESHNETVFHGEISDESPVSDPKTEEKQ